MGVVDGFFSSVIKIGNMIKNPFLPFWSHILTYDVIYAHAQSKHYKKTDIFKCHPSVLLGSYVRMCACLIWKKHPCVSHCCDNLSDTEIQMWTLLLSWELSLTNYETSHFSLSPFSDIIWMVLFKQHLKLSDIYCFIWANSLFFFILSF